jgi:hypothetical protein
MMSFMKQFYSLRVTYLMRDVKINDPSHILAVYPHSMITIPYDLDIIHSSSFLITHQVTDRCSFFSFFSFFFFFFFF